MNSSVTIDDKLRKKIKKLAAELDTTQGDIVFQGVTLLEEKLGLNPTKTIPEAREIIRERIKNQSLPEWKKEIKKKLITPGPDISDMEIRNWMG